MEKFLMRHLVGMLNLKDAKNCIAAQEKPIGCEEECKSITETVLSNFINGYTPPNTMVTPVNPYTTGKVITIGETIKTKENLIYRNRKK